MKPARASQAVLLAIGGGVSMAAVVDYFAPGMDGVAETVLLLSPLLLAIGGPYALHWFTVRSAIVAVPTAVGFCGWGIYFALDGFSGNAPAGPLVAWFFVVVAQTAVVAACAAAGAIASAIVAGGRRVATHDDTQLVSSGAPPPRRALYTALATVIAVLLVTAGIVIGRRTGDGPETVVLPGTSPPVGQGAGTPGVAVDGAIAATPRSIAYQGDITNLTSLDLAGEVEVSARGTVRDAAGTVVGEGIVRGEGDRVRLSGESVVLTLRTDLVVTPKAVRAPNLADLSSFGELRSASAVRIEGASLVFHGSDGARRALPGPASVTLEPEPFADPLTIDMDGPVTWNDPPASLFLSAERSKRTTLSWAGGGTITAAGSTFSHDFLGIKSRDVLTVTLTRTPGLRLEGSARLAQAYSGNVPQLRARADVRVKSSMVTVRRGNTGQFTWAPENLGETDMVIARIVPGSAEARWISLGLDRMPELCGGESCEGLGGDTTGFQRGKGINAVILPTTGDERDIRFNVPSNAQTGRVALILVLEGNFDPIRVEVPLEITA